MARSITGRYISADEFVDQVNTCFSSYSGEPIFVKKGVSASYPFVVDHIDDIRKKLEKKGVTIVQHDQKFEFFKTNHLE